MSPKDKGKQRIAVAGAIGVKRLDFHRTDPAEVMAHVDARLDRLEELVDQAGKSGCDALAFTEDSLGLLHWSCANWHGSGPVVGQAVARMLDRLGKAAARNQMYVLCCSDAPNGDGISNAAFFIGRDGREIGRYHKVNLPVGESARKPGDTFPVFQTPDLGGVGMLICYDMVFPETIRCLAMNGADIVFHLTMGGPNFGDNDMVRAGFRTRAVDNQVYLGVAFSNQSMIVSPRGEILAQCNDKQDLVIADIDPGAGREVGDSANKHRDIRARLFRERRPDAYGVLTQAEPPILAKLAKIKPKEEYARIMHGMLTVGEEQFAAAESLMKAGRTADAAREFERLRREYPDTWIDNASAQRLADMKANS
jgi:predicted amidohydrolase